jgi:hypothetical protein
VAGWTASAVLSAEFPNLSLLGVSAICLAAAALIAMGGRKGLAAAIFGTIVAGLVSAFMVLWTLGGCFFGCGQNAWLLAVGPAVLTVVSFLAARQMNRAVPRA